MSTKKAIPNHYYTVNDAANTWSCACGSGGSGNRLDDASTLAYQHMDQQSRRLAPRLTPAQLADALRRGASDSQRLAAVDLLIVHEWWLEEKSLRPYISCRWNPDGSVEAYLDWRKLAAALGLASRAIRTLRSLHAPAQLLDELDNWDEQQSDQLHDQGASLDGSSSELAMLRIAASIASAMPINIGDDTADLGNDHRGLVLTAVGHLLTHGGNVPFWSALTWDQFHRGDIH